MAKLAGSIASEIDAMTKIKRNTLNLPGRAGMLEAVVTQPHADCRPCIVAIAHPHPLHGGTMNNKVVHYLAKSFNDLGATALRFNFRGVGNSAGEYGNGDGEADDLIAVVEWLNGVYPRYDIWLAGFSFGAYVALRVSHLLPVKGLITIAPPVHLFDCREMTAPSCPWFVVQGIDDPIVSSDDVTAWLASAKPKPTVVNMDHVGHFFHGRLNDLQHATTEFLLPYLNPYNTPATS
jgi:hypothetical protein